MPANERSHDDHADITVGRRRRRLLVHAGVFSVAGLACLTLGTSSTSASPTAQEGRFLEGGELDVIYTCGGADQATTTLLNGIGLASFEIPVTVRTAAVEPSPEPGEDFEMEFTWDFTLGQNLVFTAVDLEVTDFNITGTNTIGPVTGATGADSVGVGASQTVPLGDGSVPVGYTQGPFTATYNRTAAVDTPIEFAPGNMTSSVTTVGPIGTTLNIACTPAEGAVLTLNDQTGVAPTTTTTTRPAVVPTTAGPTTTVAVGADQLPRTGSSSNLFLILLALGLIDIGYLALSSSRRELRDGRTS